MRLKRGIHGLYSRETNVCQRLKLQSSLVAIQLEAATIINEIMKQARLVTNKIQLSTATANEQ